jgi:hypothetical protein
LSSTRVSGKDKTTPIKTGIFVVPTSKVAKRSESREFDTIVEITQMVASVSSLTQFPSILEQKSIIKELMGLIKPKVFLIDNSWWKEWCKYTSFNVEENQVHSDSDDDPP